MKPIKAYCICCKKERDIVIADILTSDDELKIEGMCNSCKNYICRILYRKNQMFSSLYII